MLLDTETNLQWVVDDVPYLVAHHNLEGMFLYFSPFSQTLLGYHPEDIEGRTLYDFLHPMDHAKFRKAQGILRAQQTVQTLELRVRRKAGDYAWFKATLKPHHRLVRSVEVFAHPIDDLKNLEAALHILAQQDEMLSSEDRFRILVSHLTTALRVSFAFITELDADGTHVRMLAFWKGADFGVPFSYALQETPCDGVIGEGKLCYYPLGVQAMFPKDQDLVSLNAQGYLGLPVFNLAGQVIGHLAILDNKPLRLSDTDMWLCKLFAVHAGRALERLIVNQNT